MNEEKSDKLFGYAIAMLMILIVIVGICILKELEDFRTDHKCYMMEDEEFFQTEMCKSYWSYRQVGKK